MSSCEAAVMLPVETVPALPAVLSASPRSISAPLVDHGGKCISFVDAPSLASNIWLTLFLWVPSMEFACLCCLHPSPAFPHRSCQLCYVHPVLLELRTLCRNFLGGGGAGHRKTGPSVFLKHQLTGCHVSANFVLGRLFHVVEWGMKESSSFV